MTYSEGLILALVGATSALIAGILKFILKSRCSQITLCWNCVKCIREPIHLTATEVEARQVTRPSP